MNKEAELQKQINALRNENKEFNTLRGRFLAWLPKYWNRETFIDDEGDELFIEDWVQGAWVGYSAALAEPVSGGVVLPERKDATFYWNVPGGVHKAEGYNEALDDVAALNGGAVAGQEEDKP